MSKYDVNSLWKWKSLSHVQVFVTPWTVICQAPLSMGFSRQEYRSGLPCPSPADLPDSGIKLWGNLKIWGNCSTLSYRKTLVKTSIHPSMAFTTQSCNKPNKAVQCNKYIEDLWHPWFRTSSLYSDEAGSNPCSSTYYGRGFQPPSQGLVPFTRSAAAALD